MTDLTKTAELTIAAAILTDGAPSFARIRSAISEADVLDTQVRAVLEAAGAAAALGEPLTVLGLASKIEAMGLAVDLQTLERIAADHHRPGELEAMVARVAAAADLRRTGDRLAKLAAYARHPEAIADPDRYHAAVSAVSTTSQSRLRTSTVGGHEAGRAFMTALTQRGKLLPASPTGIVDLDGILGGGHQAKRMYIYGARPSVGKTALGIGSMYHGAACGHPQLMFSLEMPVEDIFERRVVQVTNLDGERVQRVRGDHGLTEFEMRQIVQASGQLVDLPVELDCQTRDIAAMVARARVWLDSVARPMVERAREEGRPCVPMVWLDYIQRARISGKFGSRDERIGAMSDLLASFARDEECAVGVLSQIGRNAVKDGRRPTAADLRDSGNIEQDANVVVLLHRDIGAAAGADDDGAPAPARIVEQTAELLVDKNRHGATGIIKATFLAPSARYVDHREAWSS